MHGVATSLTQLSNFTYHTIIIRLSQLPPPITLDYPTQGSQTNKDTSLQGMTFLSLKINKVKVLVAQSCPTLCNPMDCSPPGFSVHRNLQARILEWVAISSSKGSSRLRDHTQVSCIAGRFFMD